MSREDKCPHCLHAWADHYLPGDRCYGGVRCGDCLCRVGLSRWDGLLAEGNLGVLENMCDAQHGRTAGGLMPCPSCKADAA